MITIYDLCEDEAGIVFKILFELRLSLIGLYRCTNNLLL